VDGIEDMHRKGTKEAMPLLMQLLVLEVRIRRDATVNIGLLGLERSERRGCCVVKVVMGGGGASVNVIEKK
jgi:hypothetical protein